MHFLMPFCLKCFCGDHGEVLEGTSGRPRFSVANSKVHLKMRNAARPSSRRFAQEKVDRPRRLLFFCGQPAWIKSVEFVSSVLPAICASGLLHIFFDHGLLLARAGGKPHETGPKKENYPGTGLRHLLRARAHR